MRFLLQPNLLLIPLSKFVYGKRAIAVTTISKTFSVLRMQHAQLDCYPDPPQE